MPRAGMLRKRLTIQQPTLSNGVQKWATLITVWGAVDPVPGSEVARALEPTDVVMSNVTIRYAGATTIAPRMRILFGTRILEISSVINIEERNHELDLVCREVMN